MRAQAGEAPQVRESRWLSLHIACPHERMDRLLVECVGPGLQRLLRTGWIESFFFIRYSAGGPHLRLRLLPAADHSGELREIVAGEAVEFLARPPAPTAAAAAADAVREVPFEAETERYGGAALLPASLAFFALSSVRVLQLLAARDGLSDGRWLVTALRLLLRYALGFAGSTAELKAFVAFPQSPERRPPEALRERGDRAFAAQPAAFCSLVRQEVRRLAPGLPALDDTAAAARLGRELRPAAPAVRRRVAVSQLHMTPNRLGLRNADEVYVARLLTRALEAVETADPDLWAGLERWLAARTAATGDAAGAPQHGLTNWLQTAFAAMETPGTAPLASGALSS